MGRIVPILDRLQKFYGVNFEEMQMLWDSQGRDAFQVLVGTVLSQRTRDENTALAAEALFGKYPTSKKLAKAKVRDVEKLVRPSNFYKTKAKRVIGVAKVLEKEFRGRVPKSMEELVSIPGVGRKTAGCVMVYGFNKPAIPADTHVHRISNRLGLVKTKHPDETEKALEKLTPKKDWIRVNDLLVRHGQKTCRPIGPKCGGCPVNSKCKYFKNDYKKVSVR